MDQFDSNEPTDSHVSTGNNKKNMLLRFVAIMIVTGFGGFLLYNFVSEQNYAEFVSEHKSYHLQSLEKIGIAWQVESADSYRNSVQSVLKNYFDGLKDLYSRYSRTPDPEMILKDMRAKTEEKKIDLTTLKRYEDSYHLIRPAFDLLQSGQYHFVHSVKSGGLRLDFYKLSLNEDNGFKKIRWDFILWGMVDLKKINFKTIHIDLWTKEMKKTGNKEEEIEKILGRMEGSANPEVILGNPNNYIIDFPPGAIIGAYSFPLIPPNIHKLDFQLILALRNPSGDYLDYEFNLPNIPVPPEWKISSDTDWNAQKIEATEEEIMGKKKIKDNVYDYKD